MTICPPLGLTAFAPHLLLANYKVARHTALFISRFTGDYLINKERSLNGLCSWIYT